jgi:hypothetical protein
MQKVVYISGPMSNLPDHNFPAFDAAEKELLERGYRVINPANNDNRSHGKPWEFYMRLDIKHVAESDLMYVLDGWQNSRGARVEVFIAKVLGITVKNYSLDSHVDESMISEAMYKMLHDFISLHPIAPDEELIVDEAKRIVSGDRQKAYGSPHKDFSRTAKMWTGLLSEKLIEGEEIAPEQVGMMMVLLKLSRHMNRPKRDNLVDAHGYLITVDLVEQYKKSLEKLK